MCLSIRRKSGEKGSRYSTWRDDPVHTAALWWEWHVQMGREAGRLLGEGLYYEIRYESLVTQPANECAGLCAFLGVPYDEQMLQFHEGRTRTASGLDAKHAWLPITPGLRDWRSQMPPEDVERFEAVSGDLLDELGYRRAVPHPRTEVVEHGSSLRTLFSRDVRSRGFPTPKRW